MKILLLGEASNYNATLAPALAALGHEVTLASHGGWWMQTECHIDISRSDSKLGGAKLYWRLMHDDRLRKGYDAVFLCDTSYVQLRPARQLEVFKNLKRNNGMVFLTALGTEPLFVDNLTGPNPALPFSEWQTSWGERNKGPWLTREVLDYARYVYENVDGIATALYEYQRVTEAVVPGQKIVYAGIPVSGGFEPRKPRNESDPLKVLVAVYPGRAPEKGMDCLMPLLYRLIRESGRQFELKYVSGIPFSQFRHLLTEVDIVMDQFYAMTPATTAMVAMRAGTVPITGGHPDWLRFIGEKSAPLIATNALDLEATYRAMEQGLADLTRLSAEAPDFVARHNDPAVVAARFQSLLDF